jgi:ribosomal protein S18 acetylase RimI-like enzyme
VTLQLRAWRGWADLAPMQELLSRSLLDAPASAHIHPGDLAWWIGWPPKGSEWLESNIVIWEAGSAVRAWVVMDGDDVGEWVDTSGDMCPEAWAALDEWLTQRSGVRRYVRANNREAVDRLEAAGYRRVHDDMVGFMIDLAPFAENPPDPTVRPVSDRRDVPARASVTRAAFESFDRPNDTYVEQYETFTATPAYPAGWDLVAWAAPGRAAACTIAWPDPISGIGNFEPVATHPDFHRQGFGSAVVREGCRRLAVEGMTRALVRTGARNVPAIELYRSIGFVEDHVELTYSRS